MTHVIEDIVEDGKGNVLSRRVVAPGSVEYRERRTVAIKRDLAALDERTGPRWLEAWQKVNGDQPIKDAIVEKEAKRKEMSEL